MAESAIRVDSHELDAALAKLERSVADLRAAHTVVVAGLLPGVRLRTPFRTGELGSSWRTDATETAGQISSDLDYAAPIEYGVPRRNVRAYSMVRDTLAASEREIVDGYGREIGKLGARAGFGVK